jgi:hypothetical protein
MIPRGPSAFAQAFIQAGRPAGRSVSGVSGATILSSFQGTISNHGASFQFSFPVATYPVVPVNHPVNFNLALHFQNLSLDATQAVIWLPP